MKTDNLDIQTVPLKKGVIPASLIARMWYLICDDPELDFDRDVAHYLEYGMLCNTPDLFVMAKVVMHEGSPMLFVRMLVGNVRDCLSHLPMWALSLPYIGFARNNEDKLRVYRFDKFVRLIARTKG